MKHKYTLQSKFTVFDVTPGGRSANHYTINCYFLLKDCMSVPFGYQTYVAYVHTGFDEY